MTLRSARFNALFLLAIAALPLPPGRAGGPGESVARSVAAVAGWLRPVLASAQTASPPAGGGGTLRVELGVEPGTVTVGEVFYAAIQVISPEGVEVEHLEFAGGDTLQAAGPLQRVAGEGGGTVAIYPLVAWVAGSPLEATVGVRVLGPDGEARLREISLRLPEVASVLPADVEVEPRPAKGLIDLDVPGAPSWWWLLALLLLLLATVGAAWLLASRRRSDASVVPQEPRAWALEQLGAGAEALLRAGELPELYRRISWVVRSYLGRVEPRLGRELTTTELLERMRGIGAGSDPAQALGVLLHAADRVKFARHPPDVGEAERLLAGARSWVAAYPPAEAAPKAAAAGRAA